MSRLGKGKKKILPLLLIKKEWKKDVKTQKKKQTKRSNKSSRPTDQLTGDLLVRKKKLHVW